MVESDGELIAIFLNSNGRISVLKPDASKRNWVNVEDLGDKVIYLSNGGSWVEKRRVSCNNNRIYLPMLYDNNKAVIFYDLKTQRYHCNGYDFSSTSFYHIKQIFHSVWIKPT